MGYCGSVQPGAPRDAEEFSELMDRVGIDEALVFYALSLISTYPEGDYETLMNEIARNPRLHPCWSIMPNPGRDSLQYTQDFVSGFLRRGVRAVRIFPRRVGPLREFVWGTLLRALAERQVLTFVDFDLPHWGMHRDMIDWDGLHWVLGEFPDLPMVLIRPGYAIDRVLLPLMDIHKNLFIEISYYMGTGKLERLCDMFGPHRALFGTGMSQYEPGAAITLLTYSALDSEAKRMVGGNNLRRLLSEVRA